MDLGIKGKIALVTAASKGLGRGSAEALAAEGCRVAICARTQADVDRVAGEIAAKTGAEVVPFVADMSKAADIDKLLADVRAKLGDPDIVVCNAGGPPPGNFASTKLEQFLPAVELSMMSSIRLTYGTIEAMKAKGWGRIVYITSVSVKQPIPYILLSNTARAGLTGFMKTVAREVAATGVTVNAVLPGAHETDRIRQTVQKEAERKGTSMEEELQARASEVPMKRMGDAGDFGAVVAFVCSQQAKFVTGENVLVDGGAYAGLV
ncbi:MAG TPA: SDR family oxidoreductase [bacterium]|nr:SDR family oxidoreductase [bacterium]